MVKKDPSAVLQLLFAVFYFGLFSLCEFSGVVHEAGHAFPMMLYGLCPVIGWRSYTENGTAYFNAYCAPRSGMSALSTMPGVLFRLTYLGGGLMQTLFLLSLVVATRRRWPWASVGCTPFILPQIIAGIEEMVWLSHPLTRSYWLPVAAVSVGITLPSLPAGVVEGIRVCKNRVLKRAEE